MTRHQMPGIIRETSEGTSRLCIQDEMLERREIDCVGEIDADMMYSLALQMRYLQGTDPEGQITLYINSLGGSVTDGLAIYDTMQSVSCPIRTVCTGMAASMAAVLFAAGDVREMLPHARIMLHDPLAKGISGSALHVDSASRNLMEMREVLAGILARHTGHDIEDVYRSTVEDTYFSAREAVGFGLADRIIGSL